MTAALCDLREPKILQHLCLKYVFCHFSSSNLFFLAINLLSQSYVRRRLLNQPTESYLQQFIIALGFPSTLNFLTSRKTTAESQRLTFLAFSMAASLSQPQACVLECGLPQYAVRYGSILSRTLGSCRTHTTQPWTRRRESIPSTHPASGLMLLQCLAQARSRPCEVITHYMQHSLQQSQLSGNYVLCPPIASRQSQKNKVF